MGHLASQKCCQHLFLTVKDILDQGRPIEQILNALGAMNPEHVFVTNLRVWPVHCVLTDVETGILRASLDISLGYPVNAVAGS